MPRTRGLGSLPLLALGVASALTGCTKSSRESTTATATATSTATQTATSTATSTSTQTATATSTATSTATQTATTKSRAELGAMLERNVGATRSRAGRVVIAAAKKAYASEIVDGMSPLRLEEKAISWFEPDAATVESCERRFLEMAQADLIGGSVTVVPRERAHALGPIFESFPRYERQAIGWAAAGSRYVYLRFRLPKAHLPPLDAEYHVKDGGHAYFEMMCGLPQHRIFNVSVNGEA